MLAWKHFLRSCAATQAARLLYLLFLLCLFALPGRGSEPTQAGKTAFRFVVYGDTRDGHDVHRKLVAMILAQKPDLVLQTGDLVHRGSDDSLWKIYDEITGPMRHKIPVYPARGNHDVGGTGYEKRVTAPFTSGNKLYYSFDKGACHFVSVDNFSPYGPDSPQYRWLDQDLAAAQKKVTHIFVYFHEPPYSIGSHGSNLDIRQTLCPLFVKYGVRAVFCGHDHIYYRTKRDGITYVVSGGGGAPLYACDPNKGAIEGDKWESVHHILVCDVDGDTITATALREDGTTLDHFTIK